MPVTTFPCVEKPLQAKRFTFILQWCSYFVNFCTTRLGKLHACWSAEVMLRAMEPVLLCHSSTAAGRLAWHGTLAAAAAAAESFRARQTGHSLGAINVDSSRQEQVQAAVPLGSPLEPSGISPGLWAALPSVMACLSLERDHVHLTGSTSHQEQAERPVLRLLQAAPLLIKPFVDALINHCQHGQAQPVEDCNTSQPRQGDGETVASQQLASATRPSPAFEADVSDRQQQDMPHSQSASADGLSAALRHDSNRVMAAVQTIVVLCKQSGLLAYLLELQHQLFEAATSLRYFYTSQKLNYLLSTCVKTAVAPIVHCTMLHAVAFCLFLCRAAMHKMQQDWVLYGGCA